MRGIIHDFKYEIRCVPSNQIYLSIPPIPNLISVRIGFWYLPRYFPVGSR
jgi:hypothetical protein